jgi:hypothetical protein
MRARSSGKSGFALRRSASFRGPFLVAVGGENCYAHCECARRLTSRHTRLAERIGSGDISAVIDWLTADYAALPRRN